MRGLIALASHGTVGIPSEHASPPRESPAPAHSRRPARRPTTMNFLGRIFVFVLMFMSIVFMTMAIVVYSTHKDWKSQAQAAQTSLRQARSDFDAKVAEYNRMQSELTAEKEAALAQVSKLESERVRLLDRNASAQTQLDQLRQIERENTSALASTQKNNVQLAEQVKNLRGEIRENQVSKDRYFQTALRATEEFQQVRNDLEVALERNRGLVADTSRMASLMRSNNLDPATPIDDIKPSVDGFVSRTQRKNGVMLVEISIGSDDGLKPGHTVEVFRNTKYKGRLEILKTAPDRAVGRVDVRFQQGPILEGDRVATRIKLG